MKRRLIAGLLAALLSPLMLTTVPAKATDSDPEHAQEYAADFSNFLAFVGGVPLDAQDRELVVTQTAADLRSDPSGVHATDETIRKSLAKLNTGDASQVAERRETLRLQMALLPDSNFGRQLVERKDPTVVFDRKHRRLVTQESLLALQRACSWLSDVLGTAKLDPSFVATQRALLRDQYDRLSDAQQEALAHVQRDTPLLIAAYEKADAARRAQFVRAVRPYVHDQTQIAPLTVAILGATHTAVQTNIINDSIVLMGAMNNSMLFHGGYYH